MSTAAEHEPSAPPRPPFQPPARAFSNPFASTLNYLTEPVTYTFSGIVRRLSVDEAPTPLARALSVNYNGAMTDPSTGVYLAGAGGPGAAAPTRRRSPFQPPPLTPLTLRGYHEGTRGRARLLGRAVAEEIRLLLPPRLQLVDGWRLAYSLEQDGSTLSTLYGRCAAHRGTRAGFVLVVRDAARALFGAYLSDAPQPHPHYYGSGECFLWRALRLAPALPDLASLPPPPSADTTHLQRMTTISGGGGGGGDDMASAHGSTTSLASLDVPATRGSTTTTTTTAAHTPERIRFKAFPYTGANDFSIFCQPGYLSVGGGDGHYGLWLDDTLGAGASGACPTFGNEPLSDEGASFDVLGVEVWYIGS